MLQPISPSGKDYSEAIFCLSQEGNEAEISYVAMKMRIAESRVPQAIAGLKKRISFA